MLRRTYASDRFALFTAALAALLAFALAACGGSGGGGGSASSGGGGGGGVSPGPAPVAGTTSAAGCPTLPGTTDPLAIYQWYLSNAGGTGDAQAFASGTGSVGQDINYGSPTVTGCGVKVAVVDEGMEIAHEDLADNVVAGASVRFNSSPIGSNPTNTASDGDHGTSVAGLIDMRVGNGIGGRGVAGGASIVGYNFLQNETDANELIALGGATYTDDTMVFNQSYGLSNTVPIRIAQVNPSAEAAYLDGVTNLRGGLGAIYLKAAGNGFETDFNPTLCSVQLTCQNANMDPYDALPYQIILGAVNASGVKSSYSTAGSAIWVSAPGGEYGYDSTLGWLDPTQIAFKPAMLSTDQTGCNKGYSTSPNMNAPNRFSDNSNGLNPGCKYTTNFNGTSSATPVTSGLVALLLETNSGLTWRDVKHILAKTAEQVDSGIAPVTLLTTYTAEPGWTTNNAPGGNDGPYKFHNWYGFGRIDVQAALTMAGTYTPDTWGSSQTIKTSTCVTCSGAIPDNSATGVTDTSVVATSNIAFIEATQLIISLTHPHVGDLGIELTSPGGTRSVLLNTRNGFGTSANMTNIVLASNAFYGEGADGTWTLKVVDTVSGSSGNLGSWSLKIYGH